MPQIYPDIDMKRTGLILKQKIEQAGYSVKDIQKILSLSCPQPIYRWYNGKVLPSVDHLYVLGRLLGIHMEDLLVPKALPNNIVDINILLPKERRLYSYWIKLNAS